MPALFKEGSYDLAGYSVGVAEYASTLGVNLKSGDKLIGLPASGLHCSGFNIVHKLMNELGESYAATAPFGKNKSFGKNYNSLK